MAFTRHEVATKTLTLQFAKSDVRNFGFLSHVVESKER